MYTFPAASVATPLTPGRDVPVAGPGCGVPPVPLPAKNESMPPEVTFSTSPLLWSAMYTFLA